MLPGDQFSLDDWIKAQRPTSDVPLPSAELQQMLKHIQTLCEQEGIPHLIVMASPKGVATSSDLLDKPWRVPAQLLMARAAVCEDQAHAMGLASVVMSGQLVVKP